MSNSLLLCVGGPFDGKRGSVPSYFRVGDQVQFWLPPEKIDGQMQHRAVSYLLMIERPSSVNVVLRYVHNGR